MPHLRVNRKLEKFLTTNKQLKVAIGGRGSGKSIGIGDMLIMKMEVEGADIYCLREYLESLSDSVHRVLVDSVRDRLKLDNWTIQENKLIAPNGAVTTYKGASRSPDSIQSAQGYKYSWFEEAHRASKSSLDKLLPTILRNEGAECWFSANPQSRADPFSQRFIVPYLKELERDGIYEDDLHLIVVVNWRDNPWWMKEQESLRSWDYKHKSRAEYDWVWEGKFYDEVENSIIKPEWFDAAVDAHTKLGVRPSGALIASHDPSDTGGDAKGYALRHGSVILDVDEKTTGDVNEGLDWALYKAIGANADYFTWDCDGMGVSLKREVNTALEGKRIETVMFRGSESPESADSVYSPDKSQKTIRDTFLNKRAQYYWRLRDRLYATYRAVEKGEYINPEDLLCISPDIEKLDQLRSEVCRIPQKLNNNGKIQIMTKLEMAKKPYELPSPNMADALMMSMIQPTIETESLDIEFEGW